MSGLNLVAAQDTIAAYIRQEFPNYEVYEDELIDNESILKMGNKVKPYITLRWGGLNRSPNARALSGVRFDEYDSTVDVNVIAPTPKQCRRALNIIMDTLIGWKFDGVFPMVPEGGAGVYVVPDLNGIPHVYLATARLSFAVNSIDPGANIAP
jgi:hypothetical protein